MLQGMDLNAENRKGVAIRATAFCSEPCVLQELPNIAPLSDFLIFRPIFRYIYNQPSIGLKFHGTYGV